MESRDYKMLLFIAACWLPYLLGLDEVPGWQGFGKGMAGGSVAGLGWLVVSKFIRWWDSRCPQQPG